MSDVLIPQDIDYPGLELNIDRQQAGPVGTYPERRGGQRYHCSDFQRDDRAELLDRSENWKQLYVTVQYSNEKVGSMTMSDFRNIPLRALNSQPTPRCNRWQRSSRSILPTEVNHYQIRRVIDVYVMPTSEDLSRVNGEVNKLLKGIALPKNARVRVQGAVVGMHESFFQIRNRPASIGNSRLPDPDGAISFVH